MDINKVSSVVSPVIEQLGFELVEAEYINEQGRWILRLYVDRENGGINIGDCETISKSLEGVLDVEGVIPHKYILEVSSPGLNRPLKKLQDFERFKGSQIRLKAKEAINGRANYFGILDGIEGEDILMTVDGVQYRIPHILLAKARVEYKF